jgi:hypothetical protein
MSKLRRSIAILASSMALSSGALILTTHAADQVSPPLVAPAAAGAQPAGGIKSTPVAPQAALPARPASNAVGAVPPAAKAPATKLPAPGAPQVPEESATIRDDPTIAPDPKQSADNSVSFPNDI